MLAARAHFVKRCTGSAYANVVRYANRRTGRTEAHAFSRISLKAFPAVLAAA